jgi:alcohol ABC transporter permease protein
MQIAHAARALRALTTREIIKFVQQRGRLLSALVRPLMWLAVFAAGFYNVFGVSIIPPYKTYVTYQVYIVPGLLGIILLFHGMQSSLSMVYDREMGVMRLLLTAPLPRWVLLACKLVAGTALSVITCYVFLAVCILFDGLYPASREFRRRDEFRDVPDVLLFVRALSALATARGRLGVSLSRIARQSLHLCGRVDPVRALRDVRADIRAGRRRVDGGVLSAGGQRLRSPARHVPPHRTAGLSPPFRCNASSWAVLIPVRDYCMPTFMDVRSQIRLIDPFRDLLADDGDLLWRA